MRVRRHRTYGVKVQDYESYSFGATVELGPEDFGLSEQDVAALSEKKRAEHHDTMKQDAENLLDELLADEIKYAQDLAQRKSFVHQIED